MEITGLDNKIFDQHCCGQKLPCGEVGS